MKNYLVILAVLVSFFTISCEKDDVNEGELLIETDIDIYNVDRTKISPPGDQG